MASLPRAIPAALLGLAALRRAVAVEDPGSDQISFRDYVARFADYYPDKESLAGRAAEYSKAVEKVRRHNTERGASWSLAVNQFTLMTDAEMSRFYGYMKTTGGAHGSAARDLPQPQLALPPAGGPPELDWRGVRPAVVTAVKSQGNCGSCWAFAASEAMETAIALSTGKLFNLSPQQLTSCTPNPEECGGSGGCSGATPQLAFNYTIKHGLSEIWTWPYTSGTTAKSETCNSNFHPVAGIESYVQVQKNNAAALLEAVVRNPVAVSVAAKGWREYGNGVYHGCSVENPVINHAVVLMGYGLDAPSGRHYWLIRNSWGPSWGENGYIRLERFPQGEPCGVDKEPLSGFSCKSNPPDGGIVACGMCGVLADPSYPTGGFLGRPVVPDDPALDSEDEERTAERPEAVQVSEKPQAKPMGQEKVVATKGHTREVEQVAHRQSHGQPQTASDAHEVVRTRLPAVPAKAKQVTQIIEEFSAPRAGIAEGRSWSPIVGVGCAAGLLGAATVAVGLRVRGRSASRPAASAFFPLPA